MVAVGLAPLDFDGLTDEQLSQLFDRLNQADLAYAAYSTKRHVLRMEKLDALHRYRVLIPFEREVLPDEYTATVAALIQYLGVPVDKGALDPSHLWNFPERYPEDFKIAPSLVRETSFVFSYYEAASIEYVHGQVFNLRPYWNSKAAAKVIFHDGKLLQPIKVEPQAGTLRRHLCLVTAPGGHGHSPESLHNLLLSRRSLQPEIRDAVEAVCEGLPWPEDASGSRDLMLWRMLLFICRVAPEATEALLEELLIPSLEAVPAEGSHITLGELQSKIRRVLLRFTRRRRSLLAGASRRREPSASAPVWPT